MIIYVHCLQGVKKVRRHLTIAYNFKNIWYIWAQDYNASLNLRSTLTKDGKFSI